MAGESTRGLSDNQRVVLQAFSRALNRESHVLIHHPDLLWQQLYNRLQWEAGPIQKSLSAECQRHTAHLRRPWFRTRTSPQESGTLSRTLQGHADSVNHCAVSPDGSLIVSASSDKTLKIWYAATGTEKVALAGHTGNVTCCAISPDNNFMVSGSWDKSLKVWDTASGFERFTLNTGSVSQCAISQDSRRIISNGRPDVQVWDASTGELIYALEGICARFLSQDGRWCVSVIDVTPKLYRNIEVVTKGMLHGPGHFQITIWDVVNRKERSKTILHTDSQSATIEDVGFSPDGSWMVTAFQGSSKTIRVWDADTGKVIRELNNQEFHVNTCGFSPDGRWIVAAGFSASDNRQWVPAIQLWDAKSGNYLHSFKGHGRQMSRLPTTIDCAAFSPDGRWMVSGASDDTLRIWDLTHLTSDQSANIQSTGIRDCNYSLDGQWIVACGGDSLSIWDAPNHLMRNSWKKEQMEDCAIHPSGSEIVTTNYKQTLMDPYSGKYWVSLWDAASGRELCKLSDSSHTTVYRCGGFSPDGSCVVTAGYGQNGDTVVVWDAGSGRERLTLEGVCEYIEDLCFSPDGRWVLSAGGTTNNDLRLWNAITGKIAHHLIGHKDRVQACAFSKDSKLIVSSCWDGTLKIWDVSTGQEINSLTGHVGKVNVCGFIPDGLRVLSAGDDQSIRLWEAATGMEIGFIPQTSAITSGAVHPLEPCLVFCDVSGNLHIVEVIG